jgi:serine phosphatase RsbU (regulator of sigma subunit)
METGVKRFARRILLLHLMLLAVLLTVVFIVSMAVYRSAREQAFEQAKRQQSLLVNQTASGLKGYYDSIFSDLELLKPVNPDDEDPEDRIPGDETGIAPGKNIRPFRIPPMLQTQLNGRVAHLFIVDKGTYAIRTDGKQATIPSVKEIVDRNRVWIDSLDKATISPLEQFDDPQGNAIRSLTLIGIPLRSGLRKNAVLVVSVSARATANRFFEDVNRSRDSAAFLIDESRTIIASSQHGLIGTRIGESAEPQVRAALTSLNMSGNDGTAELTRRFTIGSESFAPAMLSAEPVAVLDKQWTVLILSPLSDIDLIVRRLLGWAVFGAVFVALSITAILVSTAFQIIRSRVRMERERHQLLEKELKQARDIQLAWLPQKRARCASLDIATVNHPASRISGDFYNWFELPDGRTAIVIGDVTGHGMAAAFLMATTQLLVRNTLPQVRDPGRCLEEINRQLCTQVFNGQFVTLQILVIDPHNDRIEVATGGHPPPLVGNGQTFKPLELEPNLVLGVEKDSTYGTESFELSPLSTVLLYTDGVLDVESPAGQRFRLDRLRATLEGGFETAQSVVDAILASVKTFSAGIPLGDDLTLVAVQLQARPAQPPARDVRRPAALPA